MKTCFDCQNADCDGPSLKCLHPLQDRIEAINVELEVLVKNADFYEVRATKCPFFTYRNPKNISISSSN